MSTPDFFRPSRVIALGAAVVSVVAIGVLSVFGVRVSCDGPCPAIPVAADGTVVSDGFWFLHRELGPEGSITVRMTSMTGTITYPPPDHDEIVAGLVPWAKSGIIVKDGLRQGSRYAALMMTGSHGVRFQHDYRHDVAGRPGGVSAEAPRWLRLTRSGDVVTGAESADGVRWHTVGAARLDGLPGTVRIGLFATSPGDLTLRKVALGGAIEEVRFTQAVGVFDNVTVEGGASGWASDPIGEMGKTDWEKHRNPSGAVQAGGVIRVSGTGDIGPLGEAPAWGSGQALSGLVIALAVVLVLAARYGASGGRHLRRAAVVGAATFVTGLAAVGAVLPITTSIARSKGIPVQAVPALTGIRVVAGLAVTLALCAMFAYGIGVMTRRRWTAAGLAVLVVAVPYVVTAVPLLPDTVSDWLLRIAPAAGFAVKQTLVEHPQTIAHYAPSAGYFPLPWWGGLAVLGGYTVLALLLVKTKVRDRPGPRRRGDDGGSTHMLAAPARPHNDGGSTA